MTYLEKTMDIRRVKDLMLPLSEYAVASQEATLLDVIEVLEEAQKKLPPGKQPHRAVLLKDEKGNIVGKIGQLAFLKALEPKYNVLGDLKMLSRAGLGSDFISSMMQHYQLFQDDLALILKRASGIRAKEVMHPVEENIGEDASISEAIHKIVMLQTLSMLVTRKHEVVGLIRLSDLFEEIAKQMKQLTAK